jgi:hypothetical protein
MSSVLRREVEVVAPLASELSGAGQSRAESSRGVLLCCHFLLLLRMVTVTVPVPRFRVESRCSHRRRVVFKVVVIVVRGDGDLGGTASLGKEKKYDPLMVRPLVGPTPKSIYAFEIMPAPPNISCSVASPPPEEHFAQWVSRQTAAKPRNADLGKHPQLTGTRRSRLWLVAERPTHNKSARPMSWGHPEQVPTSGHPRATPTRGALA